MMASVIWDNGDCFCFNGESQQLAIRSRVMGYRVVIAKGNIWEGIEAVY